MEAANGAKKGFTITDGRQQMRGGGGVRGNIANVPL